jgi:hypothetical protein
LSDENEPLQKRLQQLSDTGPMVLDEAAVADKEVMDKRAAEEATVKEAAVKWAAEERATVEAAAKAAAAKDAGAAGASPAPGQAPSVVGAKRTAAPSGSTPPAKRPYRGVWKHRFVQLFLPLFLCGFILLLPFLPRYSLTGAAIATGTAATDATVRAALGPAPISEHRTPEGVSEDVVESEGEPEVAPKPVPEVVQEEAPAKGAMITVRAAAAPLPSCGARAPLSSEPSRVVASRAATGEGMEVVLGHPTPYAPGDISVGEAVSTAHQALSQAQRVLHREGEDLADEHWCLQLLASMLKRTTVSETATTRAQQHGFDLQVEAIAQRDADSRWALANARELYASAKAQASAITKQGEDLTVRA